MGGLEVKKCVNKLMTLRSQLKSKSKAEAVRSTTQRLITDLEMNSTHRGAVGITNLCRHLHPHDTLFAECVRTFGSQSLEGWSWIKRMENIFKKEKADAQVIQTYIPPTKKPNKRSAWSAPPFDGCLWAAASTVTMVIIIATRVFPLLESRRSDGAFLLSEWKSKIRVDHCRRRTPTDRKIQR